MNPSTMPQPYDAGRTGPAPKPGLRQVPRVLWIAVGIGVAAFFAHLSIQQVEVGPDGYSCTYTDLAGYLAAVAIVVLTLSGWAVRASRHPNGRLPVSYMTVLTVALFAVAAVHVLRGSGVLLNPCDAHPVP